MSIRKPVPPAFCNYVNVEINKKNQVNPTTCSQNKSQKNNCMCVVTGRSLHVKVQFHLSKEQSPAFTNGSEALSPVAILSRRDLVTSFFFQTCLDLLSEMPIHLYPCYTRT